MEAYIDDMLVKSQVIPDNVADLQETCDTLHRFRMKLNPMKCTFGVIVGKFFGSMILRRGIEVNLEKIKVVLKMTSPRTIEKWTIECQKIFEELKQYLSSPPLLLKPQPDEKLLLYIAISLVAISSVLVCEEGWVQKPIYYTSKAPHNAETRYSKLEKLIFALVVTTRKLWPYFQAHTVVLLTDHLIKAVLHRSDTSGWIAKWALKLVEMTCSTVQSLLSRPRESSKATKGSRGGESSKIRESLIVEEVDTRSAPDELWMLHADGSSNTAEARAGLILTNSEEDITGYALRFEFLATNNKAEYEALIVGLKVAEETGAQYLKVFSDSQLAVGQIKGEYEAREKNMKKYLQKVSKPDNARINALSKLAVLLPTDLENRIYFEVLKASTLEELLVVQ
uniref:Uncharacterized protein LOC105052237 n=1 Tax=Elaeis guineensis var. tenera TaxID=51953 RepID=A0A6I9RS96_ELAGV|nr:uncharacterized protein LOC105052237 [Elaeis guineensis]